MVKHVMMRTGGIGPEFEIGFWDWIGTAAAIAVVVLLMFNSWRLM